MENLYKQFESGNTRVSIIRDEAAAHPFDCGITESKLANWTENDYFGNFLPVGYEKLGHWDIKEEFQQWLEDNTNAVTIYVRWWGVCGSDAPLLEEVAINSPKDIDGCDGALALNVIAPLTKEKAIQLLRKELQILNAYLSSSVFTYIIETKRPMNKEQYTELIDLFQKANNFKMDYAPTFEQVSEVIQFDDWTLVEGSGGYYCPDAGCGEQKRYEQEMYESMISEWTMTPDLEQIAALMRKGDYREKILVHCVQ